MNDLIVVNNERSKITLLYNQTGKTNLANLARPAGKRELNELPPDARFRIESIASEKRISSLVVADLNGDGRPDIAYYGEPKELVVLYNQGTNGWSAPKRWPIEDGQLSANALATGDLNGDGRADLVLLGENCVYFLPQKADHTLGEPEKIPFSGTVKSVQVLDIDGDGRSDLLLVNWESATPFRFRLQQAGGRARPGNLFHSAANSLLLRGQPGGKQANLRRHHRAEFRAGGDFAVHAQAGGGVVGRVSPRPVSGVAAEQNRQGAARPFVGRCERRRAA